MRWHTRTKAFALTRYEGLLLMVRHEREGRALWEVPGGHVEGHESCEETAVREVREETGLEVVVGHLLATCLHEWHERRQRRIISFFSAVPAAPSARASLASDEAQIHDVAWIDPAAVPRHEVSALLHPLLDQPSTRGSDEGPPPHFRAGHRRAADGTWMAYVTE